MTKRAAKQATKRKGAGKKTIESYDHKGKKRINNPLVGLVTPGTDPDHGKKKYEYDPHLDPQLVWAGKMAPRIWIWVGAAGVCVQPAGPQPGPRR